MSKQTLPIQGATCQGCVKRINAALAAVPGVTGVSVDLQDQSVTVSGDASRQAVQEALLESGYAADPVAADETAPLAQADQDQDVQLSISGAHCASCVRTIEAALGAVPGVAEASMNLADGTVRVSGRARPDDLVRAVQSAGYQASEVRDPHTAEQQRDEPERALYTQLPAHTALSPPLRVPVLPRGWAGGVPAWGAAGRRGGRGAWVARGAAPAAGFPPGAGPVPVGSLARAGPVGSRRAMRVGIPTSRSGFGVKGVRVAGEPSPGRRSVLPSTAIRIALLSGVKV